jgi:hypothetical protein
MNREHSYLNQQSRSTFQPQSFRQTSIDQASRNRPAQHSSSPEDSNRTLLNTASNWLNNKFQAVRSAVGNATSRTDQPLIGTIDTSYGVDDHGTQIVNTIQAANPDALIVQKDGVGTRGFAQPLTEFVDTAKALGNKDAVVNLSFDLTEVLPNGSVTTRSQLTAQEQTALAYARDNDVVVVASSGNQGGVMSALGQAAQQFDNIITVGAVEGSDRAAYSSYGDGLSVLAGGSKDGMQGTSISAAEVTGAVSKVWATNPALSSSQVIQALETTAIDLKTPGWDVETGFGQLNVEGAVAQAKQMAPEPQVFSGAQLMRQGYGSNAVWQSLGGAIASERPTWGLPGPVDDWVKDKVSDTARAANKTAGRVASTTRRAASSAIRRADRVTDRAISSTRRAASSAVRRVDRVADRAVGSARRAVSNTARRVDRVTDRAVDTTRRAVRSTARRVDRVTDRAVDTTRRAVRSTARRVDRVADRAVDTTRRAVTNTARRVDRATDRAVDTTRRAVTNTARRVDRATDRAIDVTREAWQDTSEWAKRNSSTISEVGHTALDVVGMVPVVGSAADVVNAGWYLAEGKEAEAALSLLGAVPGVGDAAVATKLAVKAGGRLTNGERAVEIAGRVDRGLSDAGRAYEVANVPVAAQDTVQGASEAIRQFSQGNYLQGGLALTQTGVSAVGAGSGVRTARSDIQAARNNPAPNGSTTSSGVRSPSRRRAENSSVSQSAVTTGRDRSSANRAISNSSTSTGSETRSPSRRRADSSSISQPAVTPGRDRSSANRVVSNSAASTGSGSRSLSRRRAENTSVSQSTVNTGRDRSSQTNFSRRTAQPPDARTSSLPSRLNSQTSRSNAISRQTSSTNQNSRRGPVPTGGSGNNLEPPTGRFTRSPNPEPIRSAPFQIQNRNVTYGSNVSEAAMANGRYFSYTLRDANGNVRYVGQASPRRRGNQGSETVFRGRMGSRGDHDILDLHSDEVAEIRIEGFHGNSAASSGAEDVLYSRYQTRTPSPVQYTTRRGRVRERQLQGGANENGLQLLNRTNPRSTRPGRLQRTREVISDFSNDLRTTAM